MKEQTYKKIRKNILDTYNKEDFDGVSDDTMLAAHELVELLNKASGNASDYVKIVTEDHLTESHSKKNVGIIYEEIRFLAEEIMLGYDKVIHLFYAKNEIEKDRSVLFECYNHWSCVVYGEQ